jgi:hypothetical protein
MRMWWPVHAMTRLWGWVLPGLIALEPTAMALYVASGETDVSPRACADFPSSLVRVVRNPLPSQTVRNQFRIEGFGK